MRLSPAARISLGLIALAVSLVLIADMLVGFLPDEARWLQRRQLQSAEVLAVQVGVIANDVALLNRTLRAVVTRDPAVLSVALRDASGKVAAFAGDHMRYWRAIQPGQSNLGRYAIPKYRNASHWGDMEIVYREAVQPTWETYLHSPSLRVAAVLVTLGLLSFFLYLRRVLQHLDPSSVVPDRVRMAFDVLTEGVMVLDSRGRVVLVNQAFKKIDPTQDLSIGKKPSELPWLSASMGKDHNSHPWARAMQERRPMIGDELEIPRVDGAPRRAIVNCAPILDGANVARGCLVTIDDVTSLHHANSELMKVVNALNISQKEIERQNEELKRLATRDPLTGCFNRRAFFEAAHPILHEALAQRHWTSCIMGDIDHFKRFNDQYGHSVGDQVIVAVAKCLSAGLRSADLLCRYGGEEFCILLPNTSVPQAMEIAERLRLAIEHAAGASVRTMEGLRITSSFGVASVREQGQQLEGLIDRADEALYFSKQNGRNRVSLWQSTQAAESEQSKVVVP